MESPGPAPLERLLNQSGQDLMPPIDEQKVAGLGEEVGLAPRNGICQVIPHPDRDRGVLLPVPDLDRHTDLLERKPPGPGQ